MNSPGVVIAERFFQMDLIRSIAASALKTINVNCVILSYHARITFLVECHLRNEVKIKKMDEKRLYDRIA